MEKGKGINIKTGIFAAVVCCMAACGSPNEGGDQANSSSTPSGAEEAGPVEGGNSQVLENGTDLNPSAGSNPDGAGGGKAAKNGGSKKTNKGAKNKGTKKGDPCEIYALARSEDFDVDLAACIAKETGPCYFLEAVLWKLQNSDKAYPLATYYSSFGLGPEPLEHAEVQRRIQKIRPELRKVPYTFPTHYDSASDQKHELERFQDNTVRTPTLGQYGVSQEDHVKWMFDRSRLDPSSDNTDKLRSYLTQVKNDTSGNITSWAKNKARHLHDSL